MNKPNIVVIIGTGIRKEPGAFPTSEMILKNYIKVLEPISNEIYTIVGDYPYRRLSERVHVIKIKEGRRSESLPISAVKFLLAQLKICHNLYKLSKDVDIVIFYFGTRPFVLPMFCSRLLGKKTVSCATGVISKREMLEFGRIIFYILKVLERINFYLADQLAVESPIGVKLMGLNKHKKKIVINSARYVDTDLFKINRNVQDRKNLIGYIGRLTKGKGVRNFVQAMPLILNQCKDLKFLIGGEGPLFDEIKDSLQSNGLSENVKLTGWIPQDVHPKCLNELRLFVFPSYSEGLPGAVQEAMACGTPVVATPVGCVPDLIKDGETGFIMEDNSPECIAENLIRALEHSKLDKIAQNARRLIEREYTYEVMLETCKRALDELMASKK